MLQTFLDVAPSCCAYEFSIQGLALCIAFMYIISDSCYMITWYVDNINFNELLWNYKFIYYKNLLPLKIRLSKKILYYENLELYGNHMLGLQSMVVYGVQENPLFLLTFT